MDSKRGMEVLDDVAAALNGRFCGEPDCIDCRAAATVIQSAFAEELAGMEAEIARLRALLPPLPPSKTTHTCEHHGDNCQEHNLHCAWPHCAIPRQALGGN